MKSSIPVGFAVPSGRRVTVPVDHTIITGRTQQSGKTTCAEAMAHRVGCPVLTFLTKPDEKGFRHATEITPYYRDRADWEFVVSILEASLRKPSLKKGWIMRLCEAGAFKQAKWPKPKSLADVLRNCELAMGKGGSLELTELRGYLRKVVPTLDGIEFSNKLRLRDGINVMDLRRMALPVQYLVMAAALDWVYQNGQRMIVLIPEAQKFFPREFNTPVKAAGERIIQEKGAAKVFLWLDTQMLRNLDPAMRGQMGTWLFGVQRDVNEAKRTLDHIPEEPTGPPKPSVAQLMRLRRGFFIAAHGQVLVPEFYVQPFWVPDIHAEAIARGEEKVESAEEIWDERQEEFTAEDAEGAEERQAQNGEEKEETESDAGTDGGSGNAGSPGAHSGSSADTDTEEPLSEASEEERQELGRALENIVQFRPEPEEPTDADLEKNLPSYNFPDSEEGEPMDAQEKELLKLPQAMGVHNALARLRADGPPVLDTDADSPQVVEGQPFAPPQGDAQGQGARAGGAGDAAGKPFASPQGAAQGKGETPSAPRPLQIRTHLPELDKQDYETIYQWVKQRAQKEAPAILLLLAQQPELRVKIERAVIPAEGVLIPLARLLKEGFFANGAGKRSKAVEKEFSRRGWTEKRVTIYKGMMELCRLGFLMREEVGKREYEYHAVPGMKVVTEKD